MRPLAVLILVLGAIATLFFAFASLTSRGRDQGTPATLGLVVRPAEEGQLAPTEELERAPAVAEALVAQPARERTVQSATDVGAHTGFITGHVVDPDGAPVEAARISLIHSLPGSSLFGDTLSLIGDASSSKPEQEVVTGKDGTFAFYSIEPGRDWALSVRHKLYAPTVAGPIEVPEQGGIQERILLDLGNTIRGRVVSADTGQPIAGAKLTVANPLAALLPSTRRSKGNIDVQSNADGRFYFTKITPGQKTLTVQAEGYATLVDTNFTSFVMGQPVSAGQSRDGDGPSGERVIELARGLSISGTVHSLEREPLAGVKLVALHQIGQFGSRGTTLSDATGAFVIDGLQEGAYTLTSDLAGFQSIPLQRVEAGGDDVEVVLMEQGSITGRVLDASSGRPLTRFTCRVRTENQANSSWGSIVAKRNFRDRKDGTFSVKGVPSGRFVVEVIAKGFASSFSDVFEVRQGVQTAQVTVQVSKGGAIRGTVVDAVSGEPIEGALVKTNDNNFIDSGFMGMLNSMGKSATSKLKTSTAGDGSFEFGLMTPDTYQIRVDMTGFSSYVQNDIRVGNGVETPLPVIRLKRGSTVSGTVFDDTRTPVAGASVTISPLERTLHWNRLQARTDALGAFVFRNVEAGEYELSASRPQVQGANPFSSIIDMRNSQKTITIAEGSSQTIDLYFKKRAQ